MQLSGDKLNKQQHIAQHGSALHDQNCARIIYLTKVFEKGWPYFL
jgi:hypothetical protein